MDLKTFIKETLVSIVEGVGEANKNRKARYTLRGGSSGAIVFDVAVTVGATDEKGGGGKLVIPMMLNVGGKVGSKTTEEVASRIRFEIQPRQSLGG